MRQKFAKQNVTNTPSATNKTVTAQTSCNKSQPSVHHHAGVRWLFIGLGGVFFALGAAGVVLPVLPTTPFMLLAAACWAKGSQRFHDWLIDHRLFGKMVVDWQQHRAIPRRAKYLAWSMMTLSCLMLFYRLPAHWHWLAWLTTVVCALTAVWMARLPDA